MRKLISFATSEYRDAQHRLKCSALPYFDSIGEYNPSNLETEFVKANARLFENRRGFGYWCWKPRIILNELDRMEAGDVLFYSDSQCIFESDPSPLFELTRENDGIGIFHQKRERHFNSTWTRGDCFNLMGCLDEKYWKGDNLATTYSVWTRTDRSLSFVREWLAWNQNYQVVSDEPSVYPNAPDFKDHRHDQSIVSLLAIKHDIQVLCDCTQFGDGYRCERCRYPRILNVDRYVKAPWLARPKMSSIIEVSTTATCALRCSFCPQEKLEAAYDGPKALSLETFEACLNNLVPGDAIYFAGFTEPCLNPHIIELLEMCLSRGHRTRLYTTGRGLKVEQAQKIAGMDIEIIVLHLPDAFGHLSHSENNVPVLDALSAHRNVETMAMGHAPHPSVAHISNKFRQNMGAMNSRAGNVTRSDVVTLNHNGPIKCGVAPQLDHSVLLPDGSVQLCCMTYSLEHPVGNLLTTPYAEILRGEPIKRIMELQNAIKSDVACRKCSCAVSA